MLNNWKECKKLQWMSLLCNSSAMWNMSQTWVLLNLDNFIGNAAKNMISDQRRWSHRRFDHSHILILCFLGIPMTFYTLVYGVPDVVVPWQRWASVNHPGAGSIVFRCLHEWLGRIPRPWSLLPQEMWTDWWLLLLSLYFWTTGEFGFISKSLQSLCLPIDCAVHSQSGWSQLNLSCQLPCGKLRLHSRSWVENTWRQCFDACLAWWHTVLDSEFGLLRTFEDNLLLSLSETWYLSGGCAVHLSLACF